MTEANAPLAPEECSIASLRFVSLRLLWDCNIRCIMCDHPWRPHREMPVETAHAVPAAGLACDKPWKEIFVNQDGAIVPCCCGPGMGPVIGNVADGLERVWNSARVNEVRAALLGGGFDAGCRCGINMSSIGRRESPARFFVTSTPLEARK